AEAKHAVSYTRYPPAGVRGVAGTTRATRFGRIKDYAARAHQEVCLLVQVETQQALDNIEAICAVDGVDGVFIGPADLHAAQGHAGTMARLQNEFACHNLFEAADRAAFLKQHAQTVRGLATFGPMPVDGKLMDALPKLEIISNFGVGVDAINLEDAKKRGIIVTNTPDVLNECVADTAFALAVNTLRRFPQAEVYLRAGQWESRGPYPLSTSLGGKTLGILGLGRIGEAIAKRALASGMKIRYHNRRKKDVPYPYDPDPVSLARNSDVLMIVTPGGAETHKLVSTKVLDALGPEGIVVNIARGSVIDEPVLLRYLQEKR